jgi:hypothetical protein
MVRLTAMMNFASWFKVVAGVALLAVALGALVSGVLHSAGRNLLAVS